MKVGILSLHGNIAEHQKALDSLKIDYFEVKSLEGLQNLERLIIPGGESTVVLRLLNDYGMTKTLKKRVEDGGLSVFGTCTGAIVLSQLGLMDFKVERNAYGRQVDSFRTKLEVKGIDAPIEVAFIRAPKIITNNCEVLAEHEGNPVLVKQGSNLAATFHAEQTGETAVHELWLQNN